MIGFPIVTAVTNWLFGNQGHILLLFGIMALSVPFFFDEKKENLLLGAYVIVVAMLGYWFGNTPVFDQSGYPFVNRIFVAINVFVTVVVIVVMVRILNQENLRFQREIARQRDHLSEMNQEVTNQNEALLSSSRLIERKNKTITDSIRYAQRIQSALMPAPGELQDRFPDHFLLYQPKDIIGGDFYWQETVPDGVYLAVADCTGHGVPGALMSMLGANLLSQIVLGGTRDPDQVLTQLDLYIRRQLRQDKATSDIRDGMDISLCYLSDQTVQIASAQRPVLLQHQDQSWHTIKGDKNPIGSGVYAAKNFTCHTFPRKEIKGIYLYTDGCTDCFDEQNTKKIGRKRWTNWLMETAHLPAPVQGEALQERLHRWRGSTPPIDDLLALHLRI